jgi:hypothetical protein
MEQASGDVGEIESYQKLSEKLLFDAFFAFYYAYFVISERSEVR